MVRYPFRAQTSLNGCSPESRPGPAFRHLFHRMRDPDEFSVAVSGAELKADFLSRQSTPTLVEQFQTPHWTVDFQEAEVRARILGFPPPGWAAVALIRGTGISSWYGTTVTRGFSSARPREKRSTAGSARGFAVPRSECHRRSGSNAARLPERMRPLEAGALWNFPRPGSPPWSIASSNFGRPFAQVRCTLPGKRENSRGPS